MFLGERLCELWGLDPGRVVGFRIGVRPLGRVVVLVEFAVTADGVGVLGDLLGEYVLVERGGRVPVDDEET